MSCELTSTTPYSVDRRRSASCSTVVRRSSARVSPARAWRYCSVHLPALARDRQGVPFRSRQVDVKVPGQRTDRRTRPGPREVGGSRNRKRWQSRRIEVEPRGQRAQPWQTPLTSEQASLVAIAKRDAASPIEDTLDRPQRTCFDDDRVDGSVAGCVEPPVRQSAHCEFARPHIEGQAWVCERASDRSGQLDSATSWEGSGPTTFAAHSGRSCCGISDRSRRSRQT